jgi:hypothetical protein
VLLGIVDRCVEGGLSDADGDRALEGTGTGDGAEYRAVDVSQ